MSDPFGAPASTNGITWADHKGELLLFTVKGTKDLETSYGAASAVEADVVILDGPSAGEKLEDILVFPKVLASALRPRIGGMVLGRLGQGQAKKGQSAPWTLTEASEPDKVIARDYLAKNVATPF